MKEIIGGALIIIGAMLHILTDNDAVSYAGGVIAGVGVCLITL